MAMVVNNGIVQSITRTDNISAQKIPIVLPTIPVNQRNFNRPSPSWTVVSVYTLCYTFISTTNTVPVDGTELILYGISGDLQFEATIVATVVDSVVIFDFPLPLFSDVFYFSANFVETTVTVTTTSIEVDITRYVAIGIYAEFSIFAIPVFDPPFLTDGTLVVVSPNDPVACPFPPPSLPGSQLGLTVNYTGGNVGPGTKINNFALFFPSGNLSVFPTPNVIITSITVSTVDICIVFNTDDLVYYSVWITDSNGINSNSIGGFFVPVGINKTDNDLPLIGPAQS